MTIRHRGFVAEVRVVGEVETFHDSEWRRTVRARVRVTPQPVGPDHSAVMERIAAVVSRAMGASRVELEGAA